MKKYIIISAIVGVTSIVSFAQLTSANPPFFMVSQSIPAVALTATTSYSYISPGVGTSTVSLDTFQGGYNPYGADSALLLMQLTATSTLKQINFRIEYSQDNVDWYAIAQPISTNATSTYITGSYSDYAWYPATTTQTISNPTGTSTVLNQAISIPTYTRYVRAVFYIASGNSNGAIWAEWVAKKQKQ